MWNNVLKTKNFFSETTLITIMRLKVFYFDLNLVDLVFIHKYIIKFLFSYKLCNGEFIILSALTFNFFW